VRHNRLPLGEKTTEQRLQILGLVLREEFIFVDREALGHCCGFNRPWWQPEMSFVHDDYCRLLRQLQTNDVPNIALRVANRRRIDDLGVLGYALLSCPTLEQSLLLACQYAEDALPYIRLSVSSHFDQLLIECEVAPQAADYLQVILEEWLISLWRYLQALLPDGVAACASYAGLSYPEPGYHWQYQQLLGCKVEFEQDRNYLAIPKQWQYISLNNRGSQANNLYQTQVNRLLRDQNSNSSIVNRVQRLLLEKPIDCGYHLEKTAPLLSLSPRTLRRRLTESGTCFRQLCLDVRMNLARDYLLNTQLTAQEVAFQIGYAQSNNFYRAFKRYYGEPPEIYRRTQTGQI